MGGVVVNNSYGGDTPNTQTNDDRYWADRRKKKFSNFAD